MEITLMDEDKEIQEAVDIAREVVPPSIAQNLFGLRVEYMPDAMLDDGDILVITRQNTAKDGDTVAVFIKGVETTLVRKYFTRADKLIFLQPPNPTYKGADWEPEDFQILGRVVMVIRKLS